MQLDSLHIATGNAGPNLSQSYASLLNAAKDKFRNEIDVQKNISSQTVIGASNKTQDSIALKPVSSSDSTPKNYMFNSHIRTHELKFNEPLGVATNVSTIPLPPESFQESISMKLGGYFVSVNSPQGETNSEESTKQLKGRHTIAERYSLGKKYQKGKLVNVVG